MVQQEQRAIIALALIMSFRMLGMFMILPIFSLYAATLAHSTPTLIGFALGIYGLTQACLQLPLGTLSDRIGRKKVITFGLVIFALGSLVAALSHSIYGIIAGRALQGAGAIGSTILATVADLTRDENRSRAMAIIGLTIGLSFTVSLVLGPMINHLFSLSGIFWFTSLLCLLGIVLLYTTVPNPPQVQLDTVTRYQPQHFSTILKNPQLLRLNFGIFSLHAILTATFIATPILLTHFIQLNQSEQVLLYLLVLIFAFLIMLPFIMLGERRRQLKSIFLGAIVMLILCEMGFLIFEYSLATTALLLLVFFAAFSLLEATLPSLISKIAPLEHKGTAMGVYSSAQFLGIFIGGSVGGILYTHFHLTGLFLACALLAIFWFLIAASMPEPPYLSTCIFQLGDKNLDEFSAVYTKLHALNGVAEIAILPTEGLLYIKADQKIISKDQLRKTLDEGNLLRSP